jgi:hypothetical protein
MPSETSIQTSRPLNSVTDNRRDIINRVLSSNFATMEKLGNDVMMPFLQDVIQLRFAPTPYTLELEP